MNTKNQVMELPDGRRLGFSTWGAAEGQPVLLFHGQPGNRYFRFPDENILVCRRLRLIVLERPGFGLSDFQPERTVMDWVEDVSAFCEFLSLDKVSLIGFSAGGPYALVCAKAIPEQLDKVAVVGGALPIHNPVFRKELSPILFMNYFLFTYASSLVQVYFDWYWRQSRKAPTKFIDLAVKQSAAADRAILADYTVYRMLLDVWQENLNLPSQGYVHDAKLLMQDWGFLLEEIEHEIGIWYGVEDTNASIEAVKEFVSRFPRSKLRIAPGQGHFVLFSHLGEILDWILSDE